MSYRVVHCIAECKICGKEWQNYLTVRKQAREHFLNTGHHVIGETGSMFEYGKAAAIKEEKK